MIETHWTLCVFMVFVSVLIGFLVGTFLRFIATKQKII